MSTEVAWGSVKGVEGRGYTPPHETFQKGNLLPMSVKWTNYLAKKQYFIKIIFEDFKICSKLKIFFEPHPIFLGRWAPSPWFLPMGKYLLR